MRTRRILLLVIIMSLIMLTGCKKQEEAIISVEVAETNAKEATITSKQETKSNSLHIKESPVPKGKDPGTFIQEERVLVYTDKGQIQRNFYRMQGSYGYSIAFDIEYFSFDLDESVDRIYINGSDSPEASAAILLIYENREYALEELADKIVYDCKQECVVESITIGEEEYPATWIQYTESTDRGNRQVEYYLIGYEDKVYEIQLRCAEDTLEQHSEEIQLVLSTLRMDSRAEG